MDRFAEAGLRRLQDRLRQRRVGVDGEADVIGERAHLDGQRRLGDDVRGAVADDVDAEDFLRGGVDDHLYKPVGVRVGDGAPERREGELADLDLAPAVFGVAGREACRSDLRTAENDRRYAAHVELRVVPGDNLGGDLGLPRRLVGQHRLPGDVADRIDPGDACGHAAIDGDESAVDLDAHLFETEAFRVRPAPHRHQDLVGLEHRLLPALAVDLDGDRGAAAFFGPGLRLGAGDQLDAQLLELARDELDDLWVVARQDVRQRLDHRDLRAELRVERSDLDADVAAADHQQPLGYGRKIQRARRIDYPIAVELEP